MVVNTLLYRKYATEAEICGQFASKTADRFEPRPPFSQNFINAVDEGVPKPRFQRPEIEVFFALLASSETARLRKKPELPRRIKYL